MDKSIDKAIQGYIIQSCQAITQGLTKDHTMREILIYGLAKDATQEWQEDLLANFPDSVNTLDNINKVKAAASAQGFHSFRIAGYNGEAPNFAKALTV